ncbi:hypothetical protein KIN20_005502 [Parelaphostrongylus tenuis]|uniref:C2H2-type domain-containing protein n=1 Tax=Parelaphostrongylus tenuis TaxID=148309 RepID=A0AAD5MLB7_PARTN|nr:hypothetical protein KIN20_005502 [Parelaphostrongylus tenuis]
MLIEKTAHEHHFACSFLILCYTTITNFKPTLHDMRISHKTGSHMVSFVLVEAESHEVLMELIQYLTGNSLKFTVAADIRRLFARTYLDVEGISAGDVSSSSGDVNPVRSDISVPSTAPQFHNSMSNLFGVTPKSEPSESTFARWPIVTEALTTEAMTSELLCNAAPYVETYPSASVSSLESRAHQIFAADGERIARSKAYWNQHNSQVQTPVPHPKTEENEKKDKLREVACQICGKRITMRRCNLRHHAAVVHSGIERYACRCGYSTVHRNTIIRHMLKHAGIEEEKHYEFTDMLTPAEAERIEHLTEECFREYRTVPRGNEENDDLTRTLEGIVSGANVSNRDEEHEDRAGMSP